MDYLHELIQNIMNDAEKKMKIAEIAATYSPIFVECYAKALRSFNTMIDSDPQEMFSRTKAGMLHNLMVNRVKEATHSDPRVRRNVEYDSLIIVIDDFLAARFRKADDEGNSNRGNTDRSIQYSNSQLAIDFVDYPKQIEPSISVDVTYHVNEAWSDFEMLQIICHHENWSIPMAFGGMSNFMFDDIREDNTDKSRQGEGG